MLARFIHIVHVSVFTSFLKFGHTLYNLFFNFLKVELYLSYNSTLVSAVLILIHYVLDYTPYKIIQYYSFFQIIFRDTNISHQLMAIWVIFPFWLLWMILLWTFVYRFLCGHISLTCTPRATRGNFMFTHLRNCWTFPKWLHHFPSLPAVWALR